MSFIPPQGNKTVMVDNSNNIVYPASFNKISVNQATIAGNNFTSVPSVIDPENATTTQLPSVASVVSYVADVVEGGSSGLIPAIQSDIQTLEQTKSNRGEFWFNGGFLQNDTLKYSQGNSFSFAVNFKANKADVVGIGKQVNIFDGGILYLYWQNIANARLAFYGPNNMPAVTYISPDDNDRLLNGQWHTLVISYDGTTLKLTDETGVLMFASATLQSQSSSSAIKLGNNLVGQMRSIKYFNFDMSDANAPYTIADYIAGKDESPLLNGTLLSLDDYSIKVGATKIVPDVSGNNNDATITGSVMGSKDTSIAKMAQLFYQSQQG